MVGQTTCASGLVDEGEGDRQAGRAGNAPEAGLPVLPLLAGPLGSEFEQERFSTAGLAHEFPNDGAKVVPVQREATEPVQQPPKWALEEVVLDQHPGVTLPRPMMSSMSTKCQFDVCGAPTSTPVRGTASTGVHPAARRASVARRLLMVLLTVPGGAGGRADRAGRQKRPGSAGRCTRRARPGSRR